MFREVLLKLFPIFLIGAAACQTPSPKEKAAERKGPALLKKPLYKDVGSIYLFPVQEGKKWGFMNEEGKKVVETNFADIGTFSEGLCAARITGKYGYIDKTGKWILQPKYDRANDFSDGLAGVWSEGQKYFIDRSGREIFKVAARDVGDFHDGYATLRTYSYKYGFIDRSGKLVLDTIHSMVYDFAEGRAVICKEQAEGGSWDYAVIDRNLKIIVPFGKYEEIKSFSNGLAYTEIEHGGRTKMEKDGRLTDIPGVYGYIDTTGKLLFKFDDDRYLTFEDFSEGMAVASHNYPDPDGFIDQKGELVIKPLYKTAGPFSEGLAPVKKDKWGFINKNGKIKIAFVFDVVSEFKNGLAHARKENTEGYINKNGSFVWKNAIIDYEKVKDPYSVYLDSLSVFFMPRGYIYVYSKPEAKDMHTGAAESHNMAKTVTPALNFEKNKFTISCHPNERSIFGNGYLGAKLYIVNTSDSAMTFEAQDSRIYCSLQAISDSGKWKDVEYVPNSWCGNSYHKVTLGKNEYWECIVPVYQGDFKTKLRYKLAKDKKNSAVYYSNAFDGRINKSQFLGQKQGHAPSGIMDPYAE